MSELCSGCQVYVRDFADILNSREELLKFLFDHGCLVESVHCTQCRRVQHLNTETLTYKCYSFLGYINPKKQKKRKVCCSFSLSARRGTFFENASLSIEKICEFVLLWLTMSCTQQALQEQLNLSRATVFKWCSYCRDVCTLWLKKNARPLGGDGVVVEIDVTRIWKKKQHHENSSAQGKCVVGIYERGSGDVFLVQVGKQDKATLLNIIKQRVLPNTTVITDCQYAFESLKTEGYILKTVDTTESSKEAENGIHMNHILCLWREVRENVPKFGYTSKNCEGYLSEYLFKRKFPDSRQRLHAFWRAVAELYVPVASLKEYSDP